jgi:hypothetical protein
MWDKEIFWPVNGTRVTDGTHETSIQLPLTLKYFSSSVRRLVCQCRRNVCQVSVARRLELASCGAIHMWARCFSRGTKRWKFGVWKGCPYPTNHSVVTSYMSSWLWCPAVFSCLNYPVRTPLTPVSDQLSPCSYRHRTLIYLILGCKHWCHSGTYV